MYCVCLFIYLCVWWCVVVFDCVFDCAVLCCAVLCVCVGGNKKSKLPQLVVSSEKSPAKATELRIPGDKKQ